MKSATVISRLLNIDDPEADVIIRLYRTPHEVVEARVDSVYSEAEGDGPLRIIIEGDERWSKP